MANAQPGEREQALIDIAIKAGNAILDIYGTSFDIAEKPDHSPVTEADRRAEDIILAELSRHFPKVPVLAEEAASAGNIPELGNRFFLVDPLDGTREFINRNGEFTVNIALIENGDPVSGVVLAPAINRLFVGSLDGACFEFSSPKGPLDASVKAEPRLLTTHPPSAEGLRVVASRSHRDRKTDECIRRYKVKDIVAAGSSLKFCLLAANEADFYPRFGRTMEWDTGAGHAVLRAAGGVVMDLENNPLRYGKHEQGYANPPFLAWASTIGG